METTEWLMEKYIPTMELVGLQEKKITFTAHCEGEVRELGLYLLVSSQRWDLKLHRTKKVVV